MGVGVSVAFIAIQSVMIAIIVLFPGLAINQNEKVVDPKTIQIDLQPVPGAGGSDFSQPPSFDLGTPPQIPAK